MSSNLFILKSLGKRNPSPFTVLCMEQTDAGEKCSEKDSVCRVLCCSGPNSYFVYINFVKINFKEGQRTCENDKTSDKMLVTLFLQCPCYTCVYLL